MSLVSRIRARPGHRVDVPGSTAQGGVGNEITCEGRS